MKKPSSRKSGHENLSHPSMKTGQHEPETGKSFPGNEKHESKEKEKSQTGLAWNGSDPEKNQQEGKKGKEMQKKNAGDDRMENRIVPCASSRSRAMRRRGKTRQVPD